MTKRLIIAMTGASGSLYAVELLRALDRLAAGSSDVVASPSALRVYEQEFETTLPGGDDLLRAQAFVKAAVGQGSGRHTFTCYSHNDVGAPPASGSRPSDGMVVIPASMN